MKILLIDDEPLARNRLRALLKEESEVEIVGECGTAAEARLAIEKTRPDVALLDVTMPGEDGIQLAHWLRAQAQTLVIMVTAHARFAVDAFEARALDYLLKPVRPARLRQSLARAREALSASRATSKDDGAKGVLRRLSIKVGQQMVFIDVGDIDWIEAAGNYMVVHSRGKSHVLRQTMAALQRGLPPGQFIRLNRSVVVNVDVVKTVQRTGRGEYFVSLTDGKTVDVTCGLRELQQRVKFGR